MAADDRKEDWLLARAKGIGGTDAAGIVGLSPWKRPIDVYVAKTVGEPYSPPTDAMWFGAYLESGVRRRYAELAEVNVVHGEAIAPLFKATAIFNQQTIVAASEEPWRLGTPDGIIAGHGRGLEIKTAGYRSHEYGKPGTDEVPGHYLIQCAWYMAVCGLPEWDLAALFHGNQLEVFRIKRNRDLERDLIEAARAFWYDNVLARREPVIDESESYARYLARKFSFSSEQLIEPTDEIEEMAADLAAATEAEKQASAAKQLVKNKLAATLGEAKGCKTTRGKVGWVRPRESECTDWESLAKSLAPTPEQIAQFTKKQAKTAYVQAWFSKGEQ